MFEKRKKGVRRLLVQMLALTTALAAGAVALTATPASAVTCKQHDHAMEAHSVLFGAVIGYMTTHVEFCYDGTSVWSVNRYAPTELVSEDSWVSVSFGPNGDPTTGTLKYPGGTFTVTGIFTFSVNAGPVQVAKSCSIRYVGTFAGNGAVSDREFNTCRAFWDRGTRKTKFGASFQAVFSRLPYYYAQDIAVGSMTIVDDPIVVAPGGIRITVDPGTPGCPGPDPCPIGDFPVDEGDVGIPDPVVRDALYDAARTVPD